MVQTAACRTRFDLDIVDIELIITAICARYHEGKAEVAGDISSDILREGASCTLVVIERLNGRPVRSPIGGNANLQGVMAIPAGLAVIKTQGRAGIAGKVGFSIDGGVVIGVTLEL